MEMRRLGKRLPPSGLTTPESEQQSLTPLTPLTPLDGGCTSVRPPFLHRASSSDLYPFNDWNRGGSGNQSDAAIYWLVGIGALFVVLFVGVVVFLVIGDALNWF
jgi:hypothetical protein